MEGVVGAPVGVTKGWVEALIPMVRTTPLANTVEIAPVTLDPWVPATVRAPVAEEPGLRDREVELVPDREPVEETDSARFDPDPVVDVRALTTLALTPTRKPVEDVPVRANTVDVPGRTSDPGWSPDVKTTPLAETKLTLEAILFAADVAPSLPEATDAEPARFSPVAVAPVCALTREAPTPTRSPVESTTPRAPTDDAAPARREPVEVMSPLADAEDADAATLRAVEDCDVRAWADDVPAATLAAADVCDVRALADDAPAATLAAVDVCDPRALTDDVPFLTSVPPEEGILISAVT
jgi:hypothetical protein